MGWGFVGKFVGSDDDAVKVGETAVGIIVHPTAELELAELDLDGQIAFLRPKDGRDSLAWPVGGGMRRIIDARERKMAAKPYMLLSARSLAHPGLPGLDGHKPTIGSISAAMEDRASRITRRAAVDDADSTRSFKIAILLSVGLLVIIATAALPQAIPLLSGVFKNQMLWLMGAGAAAVVVVGVLKFRGRRRSV